MERHRRKNLRKFGNSILYKLHNDNGTNSEGKTCKKYERKHIAQIDQERTAGSIKFGKDAKICHFAAKSTVISADSAKILVVFLLHFVSEGAYGAYVFGLFPAVLEVSR